MGIVLKVLLLAVELGGILLLIDIFFENLKPAVWDPATPRLSPPGPAPPMVEFLDARGSRPGYHLGLHGRPVAFWRTIHFWQFALYIAEYHHTELPGTHQYTACKSKSRHVAWVTPFRNVRIVRRLTIWASRHIPSRSTARRVI
jgi:hypothetical protein